MQRANNNDLPGVIQAHSGVFAAFHRCVSKVAHRRLRGCARVWEMQHIREKQLELRTILCPNSSGPPDFRSVRSGSDWFAGLGIPPPWVGSVLSQLTNGEGGQAARWGAISFTGVRTESFIDGLLLVTDAAAHHYMSSMSPSRAYWLLTNSPLERHETGPASHVRWNISRHR